MIERMSYYKRYEFVFRYINDSRKVEELLNLSIRDSIEQLKEDHNLDLTQADISKIIIKQTKTSYNCGYNIIIIFELDA